MLKVFFLLALLAISLLSCSEEPSSSETGASVSTETLDLKSNSITLKEFTSYFTPISELPTLDLQDMGVSLVLDKNSFDALADHDFIPDHLINDLIFPLKDESSPELNNQQCVALFCNQTDSSAAYCFAQIKEKDVKFYLLKIKLQANGQSELIHLGNISTFTYTDSNEEAGESYHFDITDCENLRLEFRNDSIFTSCERYTATVGKDWRVDQNLNVNDTVKLPTIENSYSLY